MFTCGSCAYIRGDQCLLTNMIVDPKGRDCQYYTSEALHCSKCNRIIPKGGIITDDEILCIQCRQFSQSV